VFRRLKVAYFSTGDEILSLGESPREGAVYDSNRYTVFGLLTAWASR
jgi:molybdopterin molybdotransferase